MKMSDADYIRTIAIKYEPMSHVIEVREHRDRLNRIAERLQQGDAEVSHLLATADAMLPTFTTAENIGAWREMVNKWRRGDAFDFVPGEVERLRELAATVYAGLGAECNLPENWLDALNNAANGQPFDLEGLLPYVAGDQPNFDDMIVKQAKDLIDGLVEQQAMPDNSHVHAFNKLLNAIANMRFLCHAYEEAMQASNEAGFAGVSAADTIRRLDFGKLGDDQALIDKCAAYYDARGDRHFLPGGFHWRDLLTVIEQHIKENQP